MTRRSFFGLFAGVAAAFSLPRLPIVTHGSDWRGADWAIANGAMGNGPGGFLWIRQSAREASERIAGLPEDATHYLYACNAHQSRAVFDVLIRGRS